MGWTIVLLVFFDSCVCSLSVVCSLSGMDKIWNFSAVHSLIELKLGGDFGLVSQISVHHLDFFMKSVKLDDLNT